MSNAYMNSCCRQYIVFGFKDKPLELWDMKTMTMLREMGKSIPRPTALEWSPSHSLKTLKKKMLLRQQHSAGDKDEVTSGTADPLAASTTSIPDSSDG